MNGAPIEIIGAPGEGPGSAPGRGLGGRRPPTSWGRRPWPWSSQDWVFSENGPPAGLERERTGGRGGAWNPMILGDEESSWGSSSVFR